MIFALAGNQNSGKTTLFNMLTRGNQRVGNFPGVTVEQKSGEIKYAKGNTVVDLPGIYSINPYSSEEVVTRDFLLNGKPDGIINIVDATNIERNLYLTLQLLELNIPTIIALNMMDEVRASGGTVDTRRLSELIGVPVVPISAAKKEGIAELVSTAVQTAENRMRPKIRDFCPEGPVHRCIHAVSHMVEDHAEKLGLPPRYAATRLIEGDDNGRFAESLGLSRNEVEMIEHSVLEMETERGLDRWAAMADMRYAFIEKVCKKTVKKTGQTRERQRSIKIDTVLTGKYTALPIFFGVMLLIFWLTFGVIGTPLSDLFLLGIDSLSGLIDDALTKTGVDPAIHSLVIDGIFSGIGSVLSFLPIIIVLFFFLSILEDTGYMARVAFVVDRLLRRIGLSGRSFVPMIIGFGCSVPAIMATRTLASERDRKLTIILTPFMSCSAKIPIYAVFCAAFFPKYAVYVMIALYLLGILTGILVALILNKTAFRGKPVPFVMELPDYRLPSPRSVLLLLWEKARDFLQRAFTVIFVATVVIWFLGSFDTGMNFVTDSSESLLAAAGRLIAPIFRPLGFGDWKAATALVAGFSAKEAVVSTLGVLSGVGVAELYVALPAMFSTLSAMSFLVFTLLYTPCIAATATIRRELGSGVKTLAVVLGQCVVAWIMSFAVFSVGSLFI
ncbi:MAG TPA: ferrous iron transport protein B [Clostridiales bacterium]|jgi:ferrous iron transport protein B|nr:ferrous iron transport protein B [Clostridiales bacterium]